MYNTKIMDIFANPQNIGLIRSADGVGECKNQESGELIKFSVKVENDIILDAKFKAFGNALLIAFGSIVTNLLINNQVREVLNITAETILAKAGEIPFAKSYCADMCVNAIKDLVLDYSKKQEKLALKLAKENNTNKN